MNSIGRRDAWTQTTPCASHDRQQTGSRNSDLLVGLLPHVASLSQSLKGNVDVDFRLTCFQGSVRGELPHVGQEYSAGTLLTLECLLRLLLAQHDHSSKQKQRPSFLSQIRYNVEEHSRETIKAK